MRVGVIQSNYIPWRGYFDIIDDVDIFVFHDDLQYTKGDWRNRNKIKTSKGLEWITVPVKYKKTSQFICDTEIDYANKWKMKHINMFRANYMKAPYLDTALDILITALNDNHQTISQLNIHLINLVCSYLGITTSFVHSEDLDLSGAKTERLVDLLHKLDADTYLTGPNAKNYLDENMLAENGIVLEYKVYEYETYPQLHGKFEGQVTILDLIANTGQDARYFLKSKTKNIVCTNDMAS